MPSALVESPAPADRLADRPSPSIGSRLARLWRPRLFAVAAIIVLTVAGVQTWRTRTAAPAVQLVTAAVTRGEVARSITASGAVNPVITVQVGTYVSGVIQALYCDYNTVVRKGQLCARIDPRPYQTVVDQDRASLETAVAQRRKDETSLAYATLNYERQRSLVQSGIASQDTLDVAKSAADQARAQVDLDVATIAQRQAALVAAQTNLEYTNIVSPVTGTVVSRNVTMGQTVAASFQTPTLFLIATDLTGMQVDASVSESDIGQVRPGCPATFTVEAFPDRTFTGTVTQVRQAPQTVQNVITYDVVIDAPNPDLLLKPGMTATVRIIVERRERALRVPVQALRYVPGGREAAQAASSGAGGASQTAAAAAPAGRAAAAQAHVWVERGGQPVRVPVQVGLDDERVVEIVSGAVKEGERVVVTEQRVNAATTSAGGARPRFFGF